MTNIKDLMNNEELMQHIVEDLEDFDDCAPVTYEVWTIGYNEADVVNGTDMLIGEFDDPDEAIKCAANLTLADIIYQAAEEDSGKEPTTHTSYISVEVETVVTDDEGTMNIGTIYKRAFCLDEEDTEEVDAVVEISNKDFKINEEGDLEVSCALLKNFNKNDYVRFRFIDEEEDGAFCYKIISKTTANTYICAFTY